jgi:hypothetical protein
MECYYEISSGVFPFGAVSLHAGTSRCYPCLIKGLSIQTLSYVKEFNRIAFFSYIFRIESFHFSFFSLLKSTRWFTEKANFLQNYRNSISHKIISNFNLTDMGVL